MPGLSDTHAALTDAVLRGAGVDRVAQIASSALGRRVCVAIPHLGTALAGEAAAEAPIRLRGETVGVVALIRDGGPTPLHAVEVLRIAAAAAATALALDLARAETERKLRGSFFDELRMRDDLTAADVIRRAWRLGCDLSQGAVMLCAELVVDRPHMVVAIVAEEHPGALAQELPGAGGDARSRVYAALPAAGPVGTRAHRCVELATRLSARLERYGTVGISSFHADPAGLGAAVRESEFMVELVKRSESLGCAEIRDGTYKLLVRLLASHPDELSDFYDSTVAAMVSYDRHNGTDLVRTLDAYLNANCNMNVTAAAIFAHRHTIASRLERIRELTGLDPTRFEDRERLGLGLKVQRLLSGSGRDSHADRLPRGGRPGAELPLGALDGQQRFA